MMSPMVPPSQPILTSPANPRVRAAVALRDRGARAESGLTLVDGARELRRALDAGAIVVEAFMCEPLLAGPNARAALDRLTSMGATVQSTNEAVFAKLAFGNRAEGLVAVVRIPNVRLDQLTVPDEPLVAIVEGIEKPGNLGAIVRSADGAGADALVAASPRTDLFNPNAIRASAGTIFSVAIASASTAEVRDWLAVRRIRIVAARVDASTGYTAVDLTGPLALVVGAEAGGLSAGWGGPEVTAVAIPMLGVADSLNVSVCAAVLLYEARRQREAHAPSHQRPSVTLRP